MLSLLRDFAGETQPQKRGDRRLLGAHVLDVFFEIGVGLRRQGFEQRAVDVLIALIVEILEQFVAGQVAAPFDDARESAIVDVALVAIAALAPEAEMDMAALDADMAVAQGRQPITLIALGVFAVADAEQ